MDRPGVLDVLYPIPNPLDTLEQYEKATHADLPRFTRDGLIAERRQAQLRLLVSTHHDGTAWLDERIEAIGRELARR